MKEEKTKEEDVKFEDMCVDDITIDSQRYCKLIEKETELQLMQEKLSCLRKEIEDKIKEFEKAGKDSGYEWSKQEKEFFSIMRRIVDSVVGEKEK